MRITFLSPHLRVAGGIRAILTYTDRLARRGHDVTILVPAKSRLRALVREARGAGPAWFPALAARVRWVAAWRPADLADADIAVATAWQSAPVVAASGARARFYLVQHYESLYHGDPARVDETYRLSLRKIAISSWLAGIMRDRFSSDASVLVTPVDPVLFHPVDVAPASPRPRVLMLHHGYPWKGVADGLAAVARAKARVPSLHLVGFGVKPPPPSLPYDEFHANPPQEKLAELYSAADIYLCPSWDEGLGMPSMEAMACGATLVTYDNGGSRDYARDGDTALVAPRRDVDALAARLVDAATNATLRGTIAARGREHVTRAFEWDRAVARMEAIFAEATSLATGRAG